MYQDTAKQMADLAVKKIQYLKKNLKGFFLSSMMAGAYVGVGIITILSLGNSAAPGNANLLMGCFFGISLTLVIFAGAELFSGHTMIMTFGLLYRKLTLLELIADWFVCWYGNLIGGLLLSILFVLGGGSGWVEESASLVHQVAVHKVNSSIIELLARAALCNWLICLAIWMTARTQDDTAKCMLIFWCLFAFITSGFEHGVANMTIFAISMMGAHPDVVTIWGILYNLFWVSIGNIIGGAGFIAIAYFLTSASKKFE